VFEALGFTSAYLPRKPTASQSGKICIVVRGETVTWTITDPDNMPLKERRDEAEEIASFSEVFGVVKEIREDPENTFAPEGP
jgi:hypothetical protein